MINFHFKKSKDNVEIDFSCNFEKIISILLGTSTLVDTFLNLL